MLIAKILHKYLFTVSLVFVLFLLASCMPNHENKTIYIYGELNEKALSHFKKENKPNNEIIISSNGGRPSESIQFSMEIIKNNNSVKILGECLSACAEYILPAPETLEFMNEPLVGYHWSPPLIFSIQDDKLTTEDTKYCSRDGVNAHINLYKERGLNHNFWQQTLKKLVLVDVEYLMVDNACPWSKDTYQNDMWLPTSAQLKNELGLKFTGSVCADNFEKCTTKIDRHWKKGKRIVVGNEVYVSKSMN